MWHVIEDFFDQGLAVKALIGWGWLCFGIMAWSIAVKIVSVLFSG